MSLDILEDLCSLDKVLLFHLFLSYDHTSPSSHFTVLEKKQGGNTTKQQQQQRKASNPPNKKLSPHVMKLIFDGISANLPNSDARKVTPSKWIFVLSNLNKTQAAVSTSEVDFGVIIVELIQKDDVFLSFKITKLTRGCGQLSALVKIVVKSFFLTLKACGLRAVKVSTQEVQKKNLEAFLYI